MLKNLKSLFFIEEEDPKKTATAKKKQVAAPKSTRQKAKDPSPAISPSPEGHPGKITGKFVDILFKAMEKNNIDGFDYLEYKQSLNSLKKMPMDEATRYQSAFAMAQTMGANPQMLATTAQHYIDVLRKEEEAFENALGRPKNETNWQQGGRDQED